MESNPYPGKFIVIEGLDGSGQTTQVNLLRDFLIKKGYKMFLTKEPTINSKAGKKIKNILEKKIKISPEKLQILFAEDRKKHLEKEILPALKKGKIVISDRYFFSSFTYGKASGLNLEWLIELNKNFIFPDVTFILKVRPEICIYRIQKRGQDYTLFEKKEKLEKVWKIFKILPERFKDIYTINGEKSIEEVFENIKKIIVKKFYNEKIN